MHSVVRRDLETVQRLAGEVVDGLPAEQLKAELDELQTNGPLWRLKVNCLRYCRFVHSHHNAEDVLLFPRLRETDSEIVPSSTSSRRITGASPTTSTRWRPRPCNSPMARARRLDSGSSRG